MTVDCNTSLNGSYVHETSVSVGASVIFHCTCQSTVQWKLNGSNITNGVTNGTLTIPAVRSSDNGNNYSCNSNNVSLTVTGTYYNAL